MTQESMTPAKLSYPRHGVLEYKLIHKDATIHINPNYSFDLHAMIDNDYGERILRIIAFNTTWFKTGIVVNVPSGFILQIYAKQDFRYKSAPSAEACIAMISPGDLREICIPVRSTNCAERIVSHNERIAVAMLCPVASIAPIEVPNLCETPIPLPKV